MISPLDSLISKAVSKIEVGRDYVHIKLSDDFRLTICNPYSYDGAIMDEIVGQFVAMVSEDVLEATLVFSNGRRITVSLRDCDFSGPEAMELNKKGESIVVWN